MNEAAENPRPRSAAKRRKARKLRRQRSAGTHRPIRVHLPERRLLSGRAIPPRGFVRSLAQTSPGSLSISQHSLSGDLPSGWIVRTECGTFKGVCHENEIRGCGRFGGRSFPAARAHGRRRRRRPINLKNVIGTTPGSVELVRQGGGGGGGGGGGWRRWRAATAVAAAATAIAAVAVGGGAAIRGGGRPARWRRPSRRGQLRQRVAAAGTIAARARTPAAT